MLILITTASPIFIKSMHPPLQGDIRFAFSPRKCFLNLTICSLQKEFKAFRKNFEFCVIQFRIKLVLVSSFLLRSNQTLN